MSNNYDTSQQIHRARSQIQALPEEVGKINLVGILTSIFLAAAFVAYSSNASAGTDSAGTESEQRCFDYVQGKIKWDYNHRATWEPENINQLCEGTMEYKEPGECFHRVMHGGTYGNNGIEWGNGTRWKWQNAVALCSGTNSAKERISCFDQRLADGEKWNVAIAQCVRLTTLGLNQSEE